MREVIQKVIATEAEAKGIIETARTEAERIIAEAQRQADALLAEARREARAEAERTLTAGLQAAEQEKVEQLARASAEIESHLRFDEDLRERAVEAVVQCVCGEH